MSQYKKQLDTLTPAVITILLSTSTFALPILDLMYVHPSVRPHKVFPIPMKFGI